MELTSDITQEDLKVFLQEAEEQLQLLDQHIVRMEREQENQNLLQEIFRAAHTLKGSSAMLGYSGMSEVAHAMENILDRVRKGSMTVDSVVTDALLHGLDALQALKGRLVNTGPGQLDTVGVMAELEAALGDEAAEATRSFVPRDGDGDNTWPAGQHDAGTTDRKPFLVTVNIRRDTPWLAVRCYQVLTQMSGMGRLLSSSPTLEEIEREKVGPTIRMVLASPSSEDELRETALAIEDVEIVAVSLDLGQEQRPCPSQTQKPQKAEDLRAAAPAGGQSPKTIRVDVEKLDELMNRIGELAIDRTRIAEISRKLDSRYREDPVVQGLTKATAHMVKVVHQVQEDITKLRMLPIGTLFSGFPRLVRDLAHKLDKKLDFVMEGQETEVDRTIIEQIRDPLVHLLRNSVDHGIEAPAARLAAGKPETGHIRLSAYHEHGRIVITVEDDGRGVDARAVAGSAVKKGLISQEASARLSEEEARNLAFLPGASTAKETTEVSGRGVGLDIVRTNIQSINGFVEFNTTVGQGTRFIISLPLTLATINGLLVNSGTTMYVIPMSSLVEVLRLEGGQTVHHVMGSEVIKVRNKTLPLLRLEKELGWRTNGCKVGPPPLVAIVRAGDRSVGLGLDSVMEPQETMVKSLGHYIGNIRGIAGSTILGDGRVGLILDTATLIHDATASAARARQSGWEHTDEGGA